MLAVSIREVQKSLKDSSKRLIEAKLMQLGLGEADGFRVYEKEIQTPGDGVIIFMGMQDPWAVKTVPLQDKADDDTGLVEAGAAIKSARQIRRSDAGRDQAVADVEVRRGGQHIFHRRAGRGHRLFRLGCRGPSQRPNRQQQPDKNGIFHLLSPGP
jgi:hypothetical protein